MWWMQISLAGVRVEFSFQFSNSINFKMKAGDNATFHFQNMPPQASPGDLI